MRITKAILTLSIIVVLATTILSPSGFAVGGFALSPDLPDNQVPQTQGYFDLFVTAGHEQRLTMHLSNHNDFDAVFNISHFTIGTNLHGTLDFSAPVIPDETLQHDFTNIATLGIESRIEVAANTSLEIPVYITIPAEGFDGTILGAIRFLRQATESELEAEGMFEHRFAHVMLVRLRNSDSPEISPDFILGDVRAEMVDGNAAIVAEIRNPMPRISAEATVTARIFPLGEGTPILDVTNRNVDFAPNTVFPFILLSGAEHELSPGDYIGRFRIDFDGNTWEFERRFYISPSALIVDEITPVPIDSPIPPDSPSADEINITPFIIIGATLAVLAVILIFVREKIKVQEKKAMHEKSDKPK